MVRIYFIYGVHAAILFWLLQQSCHGEHGKYFAPSGKLRLSLSDVCYCCRLLTQTCPRKGSFTTASPFQCLLWRCSNWESGEKRKRAKSSSWCSSLTRKGLGTIQTGTLNSGEYDRHPPCSLLKAVSCLSRQWLPRNKLLPLGMDDTVDKLRLMEGKKPSVRKSVHTAYDRAMVHLHHVRGNLNFAPSNFI